MKTLKEIGSWIASLGVALVAAFLISTFIFQPYKVEGHSMEPTLDDQQRIYVSKLSHSFSYLPKYGDIVVIDSRVDRDRLFKDDLLENPLLQLISGNVKSERVYFVKRVIGKPGDVLEFKDHRVYRNGELLEEAYLTEPMIYVSDKEWVVPENHIFVLGDNRNHSLDSQSLGFIPLDHVLGIMKFPLTQP